MDLHALEVQNNRMKALSQNGLKFGLGMDATWPRDDFLAPINSRMKALFSNTSEMDLRKNSSSMYSSKSAAKCMQIARKARDSRIRSVFAWIEA